ncbi:hypothetical protein, partial [Aeromonas hydrophila]|uniref:hypothetical protein n=1 Tax=Aeromonas hydrophila TaxID=644 RepID=UPI001EE400F3
SLSRPPAHSTPLLTHFPYTKLFRSFPLDWIIGGPDYAGRAIQLGPKNYTGRSDEHKAELQSQRLI